MCFTMPSPSGDGSTWSNVIQYIYYPDGNHVRGNWYVAISNLDPAWCLWDGHWVGVFDVVPNASLNGFTFTVTEGCYRYTVTIAVSKSQSGQCTATGTATWVSIYP
jgi:hypothetical protein